MNNRTLLYVNYVYSIKCVWIQEKCSNIAPQHDSMIKDERERQMTRDESVTTCLLKTLF